MLSIAQLAQYSPIAAKIYRTVQQDGALRLMMLGDSLTSGAGDNTSALRLPFLVLFNLLGVPIQTVGDVVGTAAGDRYLYNTLGFGGSNGVDLLYQAQGNKTTADFLNGTASNVLYPLAVALKNHKPDLIVGCIGTNDTSPGVQSVYDRLLQTVKDFNSGNCPICVTGPPDSNDVTKSYYDVDGQRADIKTAIKQSFRANTLPNGSCYQDTAASMGIWTRYPTNDYTTDHLNANAMFYDSTHLKPEGSAMVAVGLFAAMFGVSPVQMMELIQSAGPFAPLDWAYGADVASTTAVMVASGPRKNTLNMLTVYNTDASVTATVTIGRRRISQDGSTTSTDTAFQAFKVPAGATVGWSLPHKARIIDRSAPTAHYNEGWYVTTTTTCNVRASGKQVVA